ncbi:hypothetical protein AgCh_012036 [Apium graveolens]
MRRCAGCGVIRMYGNGVVLESGLEDAKRLKIGNMMHVWCDSNKEILMPVIYVSASCFRYQLLTASH